MSAWPSRCALHHSTSLLPLLNFSQPLPPKPCRFSANAASSQQLINSSCISCCVLSRRRRHDRAQICRAAVAQQGGLSYKDAGVDIDAGNELVRRIKQLNPAIGGFSGAYEYGEAGTLMVPDRLIAWVDCGNTVAQAPPAPNAGRKHVLHVTCGIHMWK
jgi:hypothetical protein